MIAFEIDFDEFDLSAGLEYALGQGADRLLFVTRLWRKRRAWIPDSAELLNSIYGLFNENIIDSYLVSKWPGTRLIGHPGRVFIVKLDRNVVSRIVAEEGRLTGWLQSDEPPLPEDLCVFKSGANWPFMVTTTHEEEGWFFGESNLRLPGLTYSKLTIEFMRQHGWLGNDSNFCERWQGE